MNVLVLPIVTEAPVGTGALLPPGSAIEGPNGAEGPVNAANPFSFVLAQATSSNGERPLDKAPVNPDGELEESGSVLPESLLPEQVAAITIDRGNALRPSPLGLSGAPSLFAGSLTGSLFGGETAILTVRPQENFAGLSGQIIVSEEPLPEFVPALAPAAPAPVPAKDASREGQAEISALQSIRLQTVTGEAGGKPALPPSAGVPPALLSGEPAESARPDGIVGESNRLPEMSAKAVQRQNVVSPLTVGLGQGQGNTSGLDLTNGSLGERGLQESFGNQGQGEAHQREQHSSGQRETEYQGASVAGARVEPFPSGHAGQAMGRSGGIPERPVMMPSGPPQNLQMDVTLPDATRVQLDVSVQQRQVTANLILDQLALRNLAVQQQGQLETQLASMGLELRDFGAEFQGRQDASAGDGFVEGKQNGHHDTDSRESEGHSSKPVGDGWERSEENRFYFVA